MRPLLKASPGRALSDAPAFALTYGMALGHNQNMRQALITFASGVGGVGLEAIWWAAPAILPEPPIWVFRASFYGGIALIVFAAVLGVLRIHSKFGSNPRKLWYHTKFWGISMHFEKCIGLSGSVNDLRLIFFRAHCRNNSRRWKRNVNAYIENDFTAERLPAFVNFDGDAIKPSNIAGIPQKKEFMLDVHFLRDFEGGGVNSHLYPGVEEGLAMWPSFTFVCQINGFHMEKHFDRSKVQKEVNKTLNEIRSQRSPSVAKDSRIARGVY